MSGELVRCIWCNRKVECLQRSGACFVYCDNCGCSGPRESTVDSASSEWNRVAARISKVEKLNVPQQLKVKIAALENRLQNIGCYDESDEESLCAIREELRQLSTV